LNEAVTVTALSHRYRRHFWSKPAPALVDVDLHVPFGSICAIIGANGAGKSTLLKILAGVVPVQRGSVWVLGQEAGSTGIRAQVSYLPEESDSGSRLRLSELLELHGALYLLPRAHIRRRVPELLDEVGLRELAGWRVDALSKGQRRRAALARALLPDPRLLILDEPLNGVDSWWCERIRELLRERARAGMTIVLATHLIGDVQSVCDGLLVFDRGSVIVQGTVESVLASRQDWLIRVRGHEGALPEGLELKRILGLGDPASVEVSRPLRPLSDLFPGGQERP